jgi:hypothetical protein
MVLECWWVAFLWSLKFQLLCPISIELSCNTRNGFINVWNLTKVGESGTVTIITERVKRKFRNNLPRYGRRLQEEESTCSNKCCSAILAAASNLTRQASSSIRQEKARLASTVTQSFNPSFLVFLLVTHEGDKHTCNTQNSKYEDLDFELNLKEGKLRTNTIP